ncbi:helix-turn-helix transcriptional regulator [Burkholderia cenocepacia]|uniref:helix-turn-helix domain-containing protein n=1 Tax=Burkholderia cenocepacia TaxID=95486 RepID=UPI001B9F5068|nr:XRE family transcriptional regulator [Burkholderia cenocepacia]MBR8094647.1 helix-turn-helix transcriptional regulator [Burkholderia cenocepacia]
MSALNDMRKFDTVLGTKIRILRQRQNKTLEETALASGLSKGYLSQVERGRASPSLSALAGISSALGVAMGYFLSPEQGSVTRADHRTYFGLDDSGSLFARLTNIDGDNQMEAILVGMPPGQKRSEIATRASEQLIHVLSGEITLTLECRDFLLSKGDCAQYKSKVPHAWENSSQGEATILWIGTPKLL